MASLSRVHRKKRPRAHPAPSQEGCSPDGSSEKGHPSCGRRTSFHPGRMREASALQLLKLQGPESASSPKPPASSPTQKLPCCPCGDWQSTAASRHPRLVGSAPAAFSQQETKGTHTHANTPNLQSGEAQEAPARHPTTTKRLPRQRQQVTKTGVDVGGALVAATVEAELHQPSVEFSWPQQGSGWLRFPKETLIHLPRLVLGFPQGRCVRVPPPRSAPTKVTQDLLGAHP